MTVATSSSISLCLHPWFDLDDDEGTRHLCKRNQNHEDWHHCVCGVILMLRPTPATVAKRARNRQQN